ncbi:citrate synthase [Burkholderia savannae]|uniref:citrate/2-methylcitrate synthase n=1 Tax=Burkholderia TaxID=32008 RepID=UPI0005311E28|nr:MULTISPECIES: citrate/2-methylcitrate synthase [Burkholderia]AOJ82050.1 citrate synthase [Burkholderia savannae]KGR97182.1 citrate synthase family protein [Burkholderia sp. ABCPW 111]
MGLAPELLKRPATRYRGTDIDGVTLDPEGLWVRERNLNDLIGAVSFEDALWHLWFERLPTPSESAALRARLAQYGVRFAHGNLSTAAAASVAQTGVEMVFAAATGLLRDIERPPFDDAVAAGWGADFDTLLGCLAGAPYLMRAALGQSGVDDPGTSHAARVLRAAGASGAGSPHAERVIDALLVAWHGGFGYVTPTVLVPRCAIGTGVSLSQAIAAGFMSSGPNHVGAARNAMQWLLAVARRIDEEPAGLDAAVRHAIDRVLDESGALLAGFGHPLFEADPRPPRIRALFAEWGFGGRYVDMFDVACDQALRRKSLKPNIDFATGAALLDLGIAEPQWGIGVGLSARIAAMAAHAVERRRRPAFGANSATARRMLAAVPVGWL